MDVAYKQHSSQSRRKNRSTTNLNHLSLAPLTSKLPLTDPEDLPDGEVVTSPLHHNVSYLQGKSAPTTPRLLSSLSPAEARSRSRRSSMTGTLPNLLPKSKSAVHLSVCTDGRHAVAGVLSPTSRRRKDDHGSLSAKDSNDNDWMLRTGALISIETRESKGQAWLVSRSSATSLTGLRDAEEEAIERELAREKELASRRGSRRGSMNGGDDAVTSPSSRRGSRSHSRVCSKSVLRTSLERQSDEGYFNQDHMDVEYMQGPDFVSLDEKLEALEVDTTQSDEAAVRRLVKRESAGTGSWMGNLIGFSLFSVEEHEEESDTADGELSDGEDCQLMRSVSARHLHGMSTPQEPQIPPPKADEGGWQDAAWLLSVASKVLL
ncbi:uncharacterized protein BCR38DRAFT_343599 [Pseudomassariella vexata]|uniref:DUF3984 domain-containing protein n=1 Tax=Pseudomassariella vexata TaxID=1141098 RepID=A0A1Y2DXS1_9PEZI|nr:uncharacterized protein BCR38DRAFT_343599 [Pseudomassariella vexata]ORY64100.1 hypothetical protein BCR38DRAFT_343599 [Pseudomassariella vexata]